MASDATTGERLQVTDALQNEILTRGAFNLERVLPNGRPDLSTFQISDQFLCQPGHVVVDDQCGVFPLYFVAIISFSPLRSGILLLLRFPKVSPLSGRRVSAAVRQISMFHLSSGNSNSRCWSHQRGRLQRSVSVWPFHFPFSELSSRSLL